MPRADLGSVYNHSATIQEIECHNVPFFSGSNPMYLWHNRLLAIKITSFVGNPLATSSMAYGYHYVHCTQVKANSICLEKKSLSWKTVNWIKALCSMYEMTDRHCLDHICCMFQICQRKPQMTIFFFLINFIPWHTVFVLSFYFIFVHTVWISQKHGFVTFQTTIIPFWALVRHTRVHLLTVLEF